MDRFAFRFRKQSFQNRFFRFRRKLQRTFLAGGYSPKVLASSFVPENEPATNTESSQEKDVFHPDPSLVDYLHNQAVPDLTGDQLLELYERGEIEYRLQHVENGEFQDILEEDQEENISSAIVPWGNANHVPTFEEHFFKNKYSLEQKPSEWSCWLTAKQYLDPEIVEAQVHRVPPSISGFCSNPFDLLTLKQLIRMVEYNQNPEHPVGFSLQYLRPDNKKVFAKPNPTWYSAQEVLDGEGSLLAFGFWLLDEVLKNPESILTRTKKMKLSEKSGIVVSFFSLFFFFFTFFLFFLRKKVKKKKKSGTH